MTGKITEVQGVFEAAFNETYERDYIKKLLEGLDLPAMYKHLTWKHLMEKVERDAFSRWEVYNALTNAISHHNTDKSVVTKGKYEREVYSVLYSEN